VLLTLGNRAAGVFLGLSERPAALPDVVVTNLHRRYTGVSATVRALVPLQRQAMAVGLLDWGGLGLGDGAGGEVHLGQLLRWGWTAPRVGRWRIWHARRDNELLIGLLLRSLLRQPWKVVFTSAAPKPPGWWLRHLLRRSDAVIATSPRSAEFLEHCDAVIFHGVDCQVFHPLADRQAALAEVGLAGQQVIASFGRIRHGKGTDLFVEALIQVLPRHSGWIGVVTGLCQRRDQRFVDSLKQRIVAAGLEQRIWFVGDLALPEIRRWYQRASICVAASRREGFGLTPLEAMASGCVPITSQAGAWPWIIRPEFGSIVETGKFAPLVDEIEELIAAPERLAGLAANARRVAVERHALMHEACQINRLYAKLQA
jgi:mannosyltransferase